MFNLSRLRKNEKNRNKNIAIYWVVGTAFYFLMLILFFIAQRKNNVIQTVNINLKSDNTYYVAVLSKENELVKIDSERTQTKDSEIQSEVSQYADQEGYHLKSEVLECKGNTVLKWNNNSDVSYKLLLYFPDQQAFIESTAFDIFTSSCNYIFQITSIENRDGFVPICYYDLIFVWLAFLGQIGTIIWIKIGIGYLFKFREKRQIIFIAVTTLLMQAGVGIYLLRLCFQCGLVSWLIASLIIRTFACLFNIFMYTILLPSMSEQFNKDWKSITKIILYVILTELVCTFIQMLLFVILPGVY